MNYVIYVLVGYLILNEGLKKVNFVTATYNDLAEKYGKAYKVEPSLILAIIKKESGGNPIAIGTSKEIGLMQITPIALQEVIRISGLTFSNWQLFEPDINIQVGSYYISYLINYYNGNIFNALKAYNGGITGTKNNPTLSIEYANQVLKYQKEF